MEIVHLSEYNTSVHTPVLLHQFGKALEENKVLAKKMLPSPTREREFRSPSSCTLLCLQRKMLFAFQLLGCAKNRLKLPGSPSNAGW